MSAELEVCPHGVPWGDPACFTSFYPGLSHNPRLGPLEPAARRAAVRWEFALPTGTDLYRMRARRLYRPASSGQGGTTRPSNPPHGPWHSLHASVDVAGIRRGILQLVTPLDTTGSSVVVSEEVPLATSRSTNRSTGSRPSRRTR